MHHHHRKKGAITMPESTIERIDLDPTQLLVDVNIRKDARLDKDFVASIKELGVVVPIIAVRTAASEVRVRFGHRRTLAAIEAGLTTVPVEIVGDEATDDAGQIDRILKQHAENVHRQGLTAGEKVEVVAQLSAFGVRAADITKKTRIPKKDVKAAITVAGSDLAKAASERYNFLTLEQAAAVAEFQDDGEAVKRLILAAQQSGFDHHVQRLREDRQEKAEIAKAEGGLLGQGVTVIEPPEYNSPIKTLVQIRRTKKTLTDQAHEACPGHAALLRHISTTTTMTRATSRNDWSPRSPTSAPTRLHTGTSKRREQPPIRTLQETPAPRMSPKIVPERNAAGYSPTTKRGDRLRLCVVSGSRRS
jgi:ParB family chromosome partitioning protein